MYVCVCHAVTDRDIAAAVADGTRSLRELRQQTGLASTCGRCAQCAHACLKDAVARSAQPVSLFRQTEGASAGALAVAA